MILTDANMIAQKLTEIENIISDIKSMLGEEGAGSGAEASEQDEEQSTRQQCPSCGSLSFKKQEDKNKVIYYHQGTPIYAKKGVCNKCGTEWEL